MKLVTVPEMQAIEKEADAQGLSYEKMMENAGLALGRWVNQTYISKGKVLGLIGSGNNGGDTLVALHFLQQKGWEVSAFLTKSRPVDDPLLKPLVEEKAPIFIFGDKKTESKLEVLVRETDVILDGVLGTGIKLPLKTEVAGALSLINQIIARRDGKTHVIAVDCPSSIDSDTGDAAPECIPAETTICMAAVKRGLLKFPAYNFVGEIQVVEIGLTQKIKRYAEIHRNVVDLETVRTGLPPRKLDAHKGTFGTAMVIAGSLNYTGAPMLAGKAAYRVGAGLVTLAVPEPLHRVLAGYFPEATWLLLANEMGVISEEAIKTVFDNLSRISALLLGPGWGVEQTTANFLSKLLTNRSVSRRGSGMGFLVSPHEPKQDQAELPPLVIDADGLKLLAQIPDWPRLLPTLTVLTPHPGEMAILTGLTVGEIQTDRIGFAEKFAQQWGHVVVLKGAFTVVAEPGGETAIIPVATPALARAGTGDVLAGMITGLRAQNIEAFPAAYCGAWIHAKAGLKAAEVLGNTASVMAGDVLQAISSVMTEVEK